MKYRCKKYAVDAATARKILQAVATGDIYESHVWHHRKRRNVVYGMHKITRKLIFIIVDEYGTTDETTIKTYTGRIRIKQPQDYASTNTGENCQLFT